ncbi:MAG: hypothetical protein M1813_002479 [Trichoglossum hirsutum]|nr:MAG: hypothetical protein M1813_002479 [Trichoglossum hirsutum]
MYLQYKLLQPALCYYPITTDNFVYSKLHLRTIPEARVSADYSGTLIVEEQKRIAEGCSPSSRGVMAGDSGAIVQGNNSGLEGRGPTASAAPTSQTPGHPSFRR